MQAADKRTAKLLCDEAMDLIRTQNLEEAEKRVKESLKIEETSEAYRHLAVISAARRDADASMSYLEQALETNIDDDIALALMAEALLESGDTMQAIGHYMLAIKAKPDELRYKQRFVALAGHVPFAQYNPHVEEVLLICLNTPDLDCTKAQSIWYTTLYNHPDFKEIIKVSNQGSYPRFNRKAFERVKDLSPLTKEIFIKALKKILVLNPLFEEFLTVLRQMLLNDLDENASRLDRDSRILLATHLSDYCFMTEFIFDVTEEEQSKVNALRSRLESDPDAMADAACVSTFACYDLLASLSSAAKIEELHAKNEVMHDLIHAQISRVHEEREIAQDIPSLTAIEDEISQKVREQYEEFPYPRWREVPKDVVTQECLTNEYKPADGAKVLIAGCGTGQEVVLHSYIWPHTDILAVDISRTSMAYAIGKTKDAGQENITYRHADILKLGEALEPESFDHISCGGVLHHMRDPLEGWKSLMGLLKPGGSMLISLYSDTARQIIARTRQIIADQGVANDRKSMLAFRRALPDLLSREDMMEMFNAVDFYTTSMFRDFIFHVQEHRFTIPQIADALEKFDLEFDRFLLPDPVLIRFRKRFPEDGSEHVLKNWEIFEKENPLTFAHMYSFLSRKKK